MNALELLAPMWHQLLRPFFVVLAILLGRNAERLSNWLVKRTSARMALEFAEDCERQWTADFYELPSWLRLQSSASIFFSSKILEGRRRQSKPAASLSGRPIRFAVAAKADPAILDDWSADDFDYVTGMAGRRSFQKRVARLGSRFRPGVNRLSVIVVGLDDFSSINGQLGRLGGNAVLRELGRRIRRTLRSCDYLGRVGFDAFAIALPNTTPREASAMAERLRETCALSLTVSSRSILAITGSVGLVCKTEDIPLDDLLDLANAATKRAKSGACKCVCRH